MNRNCPACGVVFWKDPGEALGAMYVDYAIATAAFLIAWIPLAFLTQLNDTTQVVILAVIAAVSVMVFHPLSRSIWTVMVYVSGGIERPPMRAIRGGKALNSNR